MSLLTPQLVVGQGMLMGEIDLSGHTKEDLLFGLGKKAMRVVYGHQQLDIFSLLFIVIKLLS